MTSEYRIPRYRIQLVKDGNCKSIIRNISSPQDTYELLAGMIADSDRETFVVMMLDTRHNIIGVNVVAVGALDACMVHPREVFKPALLCNAAAVIMAHNHPSGDPSPSREDMALTAKMKQAGDILGVAVLDHIVIGDGRHVSMKERGIL